jgi:1-acyl-sn-glycerol-3-phosphate acyltransferase
MRILQGLFGNLWKIYIFLVFSVFAILLYPFFRIVLLKKSWSKFSFKLFMFWSWLMRIFCFYVVRCVEREELPEGPYIIAANHTSYLDIFFMYSILPKHPFVFLGKSEILTYPIIRTYFKNLNIPVFRNDRKKVGVSFQLAVDALKDGWSLVIFPEGTIPEVDIPKMVSFKNGTFKIAKEAGVPIVPITFTTNHLLFSDPTMIFGPARPGIARLYIGKYISKEVVASMSFTDLNELCFSRVEAPLKKEYPHLYSTRVNA